MSAAPKLCEHRVPKDAYCPRCANPAPAPAVRAVAVHALSRDEARSLTDDVKHDAERLWAKLLELHEGGAHLALGYSSWGSYFSTEFGGSSRRGYELLKAGRVLDAVRNSAPAVEATPVVPANEAQANELVPLLDKPDKLREAWSEAVERHGEPTAAQVREVVEERQPRMVVPLNEELLERQQRENLIASLDRAIYALESPPSAAVAEAQRLLAGGDSGPFTPDRFERAIAYCRAFADALKGTA